MFRGILIDKAGDQQTVSLRNLEESQLPEGNVTVRVSYSTMNYKDALAITGYIADCAKLSYGARRRFRRHCGTVQCA